jgi:DNA-binding protein YbaB
MFNQGKMNKMLKQAKAMQYNMAKVQEEAQSRLNAVTCSMLGGLNLPGM